MTPYYDVDGIQIYLGDCREVLPTLEAGSVHCCVTSPPYWGLRDYGVYGQLGLESTPDEYVVKMVSIFREVRRVLRDDGTLWLNLGSSFASGGMRPSQSPLLRAPACGSDGRESRYSQDSDRACSDFYDGLQDEIVNRRAGSVHNARCVEPISSPLSPTNRDTVHQDCETEPLVASSPVALRSTTPESSSQLLDASYPSTTASASLKESPTSPHDGHPTEHTAPYTCDTSQKSPPLVVRIQGKESFFSACQKPDCKGVGKCGLCWCSLAIPSLSFKAKDEINLPHLVAMALQADGWFLRSTIIWHKPNPMPESVTDRPTKSHEYIFLMTKSATYFYDAEAVKEKSSGKGGGACFGRIGCDDDDTKPKNWRRREVTERKRGEYDTSRNLRTIWTIPTQSFKGAHFAVFPEKLIEPCIKAGTSEKGCCPECGAPWKRIVEKDRKPTRPGIKTKCDAKTWDKDNMEVIPKRRDGNVIGNRDPKRHTTETTTVGWKRSCKCGVEHGEPEYTPVPCTVLDPFTGSGTTAVVARKNGCRFVGCELNEKYFELIAKRLEQKVFQWD